MPKDIWPTFTCGEGDGWLVKVVSSSGTGNAAVVRLHFVRARTRDDRPFQDVRLLASALQPPPDGAAAAAAAAGAAGAHAVVRGGVTAFDEHAMLWQLDYSDGTARLQRRYDKE